MFCTPIISTQTIASTTARRTRRGRATALLALALGALGAVISTEAASAASREVGAPITMVAMTVSNDATFTASTRVHCVGGRLEGTVTVANTGTAPGRFQAKSPEGMLIGDFPLVPGFDGIAAFSSDDTPWFTVTNHANPSKTMTFGPWDAKAICAADRPKTLPSKVLTETIAVELAPAVVIEKLPIAPSNVSSSPRLSRGNSANKKLLTTPRKK